MAELAKVANAMVAEKKERKKLPAERTAKTTSRGCNCCMVAEGVVFANMEVVFRRMAAVRRMAGMSCNIAILQIFQVSWRWQWRVDGGRDEF